MTHPSDDQEVVGTEVPVTDPAASTTARDDAADGVGADWVDDLDPLTAMTRQRDEMRLAAQQIQADFENYKKRVQRDQASLVERANERLLEELLPALDSFELAAKSLETGGDVDVEKLSKGVTLAIGQLLDALERAGLLRIEAHGEPFDPEHHEAVIHDDGDGEPVVDAVLRPGYKLKSKVLRPAMVKVTRANRTE